MFFQSTKKNDVSLIPKKVVKSTNNKYKSVGVYC